MKRQLVKKGILILVVSVAVVLCFVLQPFDSVNAGPPTPTPAPEKTWLRLDVEALKENLSILEHDASVSKIESTCTSTSAEKTSYSIADAEIREGYPTTNYGSSARMWCGYDDSYDPDGRIMRCLVKSDISGLPAGATINSATLRVYLVQSYDYSGRTRTYTAYRIPSDWSENTVTWNNAPSSAEAYGSTGITHGAWGWYSFDVTELVRAWYNGTCTNYGIMLRGPEWSGSDSSWRAFSTKENGDFPPPYLVVDYTPPTLGASPTLLRFRAYGAGPDPAPQTVTISNITAGSLDWSAAKVDGAPWLELDRTSGTVTPSSPNMINASVDVGSLAYGTYTERITVTKTSELRDCSNRTIDVVLEYEAGAPPVQQIFLPLVSKNWDGTRDAVALVVGVAQYPYFVQSTGIRAGGDPSQLQYPDDDARDISGELYQAGFRGGDVMTLIDSGATKAAIDAAFNWLDARENENTLVVFSISSHGGGGVPRGDDEGGVPDTAPYDEADGYDEFVAPSDATLAGDNIILDDELEEWLSRLESKHIVVVIDSCNMGGPDGMLADISRAGRVVLVASRIDQESREFEALENGVFSYYFVEGLSSTIADGDGNGWISAEEAFSYLECRVDNYVYDHTGDVQNGPFNQNPQLYDGTIGEEWITQP